MRLRRGSRKPPVENVLPLEELEGKPLVLVCDDNASVTDMLGMMLTLEGWSVAVATDGLDGLAAIEKTWPDIVILDQRMPGLSGLEVAAKARGEGFDRPILLFSGHLERDQWKQLDELGLLPVSKLDSPAIIRHVVTARRQYLSRLRRQGEAELED